jgi:hypothetical protein
MLSQVNLAAAPHQRMDIADDTFLVADPEAVAFLVADPSSWRTWWPDLQLTVTRDRGVKGLRWAVGGAVTGSMEVWLEPWGDGVVLHWYLRAEPTRRVRRPQRERTRRALAWKRHVHALKDRLEADREPGSPRVKEGDEPAESP